MELQKLFRKFMSDYSTELDLARKSEDFKRPFGDLVRHDITSRIKEQVDESVYSVKGSVGAGRWTGVPWVAIFDKRITKSAQRGVYIVYLLNKDSKELYLTLNQGAADVAQEGGKDGTGKLTFTGIASANSDKTTGRLKTRAQQIRDLIDDHYGLDSGSIDTGSKAYDAGCIFYKKYGLDNLPGDGQLFKDLQIFVNVYKLYYERVFSGQGLSDDNSMVKEGKGKLTEFVDIDNIKRYISSKGFCFENGLVENYFLCLKSKPFVILAGISGTGKSKLVELFAEACGATDENGRFKLVPVRPDWSDSSDLFGHMNLSNTFVEGSIIRFIKRAIDDRDNPYFLCLDEMNLARVEYYFSDFLSVIETRKWSSDKSTIISGALVKKELWQKDPDAVREYGEKDLVFPDNLYVVGTVNMDETTFSFSRKVLDRANTIEFSDVNLIPAPQDDAVAEVVEYDNSFLKSEYLQLPNDENLNKYVHDICTELEEINDILAICGSQVAYRVRDELVCYRVINRKYGLLSENDSMDFEIMQKILPRLQGSSSRVKRTLCKLFVHCAGDFAGFNDMDAPGLADNMNASYEQLVKAGKCKYPRSAKKVVVMVERFEEDGFTTFWA